MSGVCVPRHRMRADEGELGNRFLDASEGMASIVTSTAAD